MSILWQCVEHIAKYSSHVPAILSPSAVQKQRTKAAAEPMTCHSFEGRAALQTHIPRRWLCVPWYVTGMAQCTSIAFNPSAAVLCALHLYSIPGGMQQQVPLQNCTAFHDTASHDMSGIPACRNAMSRPVQQKSCLVLNLDKKECNVSSSPGPGSLHPEETLQSSPSRSKTRHHFC